MAAIRVFLGGLPPLAGEMLVAMLGGPDAAEVVGRCDSGDDVLAAAHVAGATLLVMAEPAPDAPLAALLAPMSVLSVPASGDNGRLVVLGGAPLRLDRARLTALAGQLQAVQAPAGGQATG